MNEHLDDVVQPTDHEQFLHKYSHRWNLQPVFFVFLLGTWAGCVAFYIRHKIFVIEPKWVEDYGQDYPVYKALWLQAKFEYWRIRGYHLEKYRFFNFKDEQMIDPLNKESLGAEAFRVYQNKRLLRELAYLKKRNNSFDFLCIGEDDIEDYDDNV